jgi:hypothetical protein
MEDAMPDLKTRENAVRRRCDRRGLRLFKSRQTLSGLAQYQLIQLDRYGSVAKVAFGPTPELAHVERYLNEQDQIEREKRTALLAERS